MFERSREPEQSKEQKEINPLLAGIGLVLTALDIKNFFYGEKSSLEAIAKEVKTDILANPTTTVESIIGGLASAVRTVVEYEEKKERKDLEIRQKTIANLQSLDAAEKRAAMLKGLSEAQKDALLEILLNNSMDSSDGSNQKRAKSFEQGIHIIGERAKQDAEADVDKIAADLLKQGRS